MNVYIYQAALWCNDCGAKIKRRRLHEIKIPLKEFLQQIGRWDQWRNGDKVLGNVTNTRRKIRQGWNIPLGAKKVLPPDFDPKDESSYDSDFFPKGPYCNGGGEADNPQHCDHCCTFLENPLTADGYKYVRECVWDRYFNEDRPQEVVHTWEKFYEIPNPKEWLTEMVPVPIASLSAGDLKAFKARFIEKGK
jgi:hypothetical protein